MDKIVIDKYEFNNVNNPISLSYISNSQISNNKLANDGVCVCISITNSLFVDVINNTILKGLHYGIHFSNTNNSVIRFNNLSFETLNTISNPTNVYGILVQGNSNNVSIYSNNVSDFYESIVCSPSNDTRVYNNIVYDCRFGIKFFDAQNGCAYNNTVKNCYNVQSKSSGPGFCILNNVFNITIENNNIFNNSRIGISIKNSSNI
ncbi:hypothetical protein ALNOE001_05320 [Candidatus Methanobinarius endosymbioticus]|uniref:Right handed beta helix domain-containing protein n=1 Tax=Candidatus Methanobinarius endosymbioticus TaxID=2006182 RepID=A0A366MCS0_9EURY|nr:hypothetical protein ALNOE001_05320 [Candidatus Methanobinarius endosymbioticus]